MQVSKAGKGCDWGRRCIKTWCCLQCGGEKGAVAAAEPYLKLMGKNVVNCGQSGNGQAAKVFFNPYMIACISLFNFLSSLSACITWYHLVLPRIQLAAACFIVLLHCPAIP